MNLDIIKLIFNFTVQCGPGTFYDTTTKICLRCAKGSYSGSGINMECTQCHSSQTTASDGATDQSACKGRVGVFYTETSC